VAPDLVGGRYRNPIVFSYYSDPDVLRVGDDYYMRSFAIDWFRIH